MNKHSRNTISDRQFFLGIEANVLLRVFYYNALGAFFLIIGTTHWWSHKLASGLLISNRQSI